MPRMTADQISDLMAAHFPQARGFCEITALSDEHVECVVRYRDDFLRPGGTLSGSSGSGSRSTLWATHRYQ